MNILFPVLAGSEYRQFFLSGIIPDLLDEGNNIYAIVKNDNEYLVNELISFEPRVVILHHANNKIERTLFSYIRLALDNWHDSRQIRWRYSPKAKTSLLKSIITSFLNSVLSVGIINSLALKWEARLLEKVKVPDESRLLIDNNIEKIIVNNARFLFYPGLFIAAKQRNTPVDVIYHTNKEMFAQPRISYNYRMYGVWNTEMKENLKERYKLNDNKIAILGNTHFNYLFDSKYLMSKGDFFKKFEITETNCLIILYTAAGIIVQNEYLVVKCICSWLKQKGIYFKIIVRKNPMDTTKNWENAFSDEPFVYIQKPLWFMNLEIGLNYTKKEDLVEYASLLNYMTCCINIPSTVTLEAAIMKKPVINVCYEFPGVFITTNNGSIRDFWDAPYYRQFYDNDFVIPAFDETGMFSAIKMIMSETTVFKDYERCVSNILPYDAATMNRMSEQFIITLN